MNKKLSTFVRKFYPYENLMFYSIPRRLLSGQAGETLDQDFARAKIHLQMYNVKHDFSHT